MPPKPAQRGISRLLEAYRRIFRVPENLEYYSPEDFQIAEKKFIRYLLRKGDLDLSDAL